MIQRFRSEPWASWVRRARTFAASAGLVTAIVILLRSVHGHYPVQHWLIWHYLQYWLFAAAFTSSCTSVGLVIVQRLCPRLPMLERLVFSMASGVLVFTTAMFLGGILGLFGTVFAIVMPVALFAIGAWPAFKYARRVIRKLNAVRRSTPRPSTLHRLCTLLGWLGIAMVYVTILIPENTAYDARWYHLPLAEHYAAAGGIVRFDEGWVQGALPQLASLIYVWPQLFPKFGLFNQVLTAAHLEFVLFLWTLLSVPVLVRWLVPRARVLVSWAAFFLFSSIFVYDAGLTNAADHVAAFWAIPIFLALRRAWPALDGRACALLGVMCAGAALTKYQSIEILAFPLGAIAVRALGMPAAKAWARLRKRSAAKLGWAWLVGPATVAATMLVATTPHWLKNWIWYGDPLFPVLHRRLTPRPWHADSEHFYKTLVERHFWRPVGTAAEKAEATLGALFTFAFKPHDWGQFHGLWPVFGFLFTLVGLALPFVKASRRVWALFFAAHLGIVVWFLFSHQDRYLQIIMPWMVCYLAAVIALAWRMGWWVRVPLIALVQLQMIWSVSTYFLPSHIYARNRWQQISHLLSSGYRRDYKDRFRVFADFAELGRAVPPKAKILLHRFEGHAGIRRMTVTDHPSWQSLISYARHDSHRSVFELLRSIGVTHVAWIEDDWLAEESLAADLRFAGFVTHVGQFERRFGGLVLAELPAEPPSPAISDRVLYLGCKGYSPGLYELDQLTVYDREPSPGTVYPRPEKPAVAANVNALVSEANYVVTNKACTTPVPALNDFVRRASRKQEQIFVRRQPLETTAP